MLLIVLASSPPSITSPTLLYLILTTKYEELCWISGYVLLRLRRNLQRSCRHSLQMKCYRTCRVLGNDMSQTRFKHHIGSNMTLAEWLISAGNRGSRKASWMPSRTPDAACHMDVTTDIICLSLSPLPLLICLKPTHPTAITHVSPNPHAHHKRTSSSRCV